MEVRLVFMSGQDIDGARITKMRAPALASHCFKHHVERGLGGTADLGEPA